MIEFPYRPIQGTRDTLYRPRAMVKLSGPSRSLMVDCLVDSGADVSVFSWQVGRALGWFDNMISREQSYTLDGLSGNVACYQRQVEVEIGTILLESTVMWALSDDVPNILGRQDVFDRFNIEFCQSDKKVIFRPS